VNIYIIGFMGSGKSTTGKKLASALGWFFCDTDKMIEERESISIPEIFTAFGENYFREKERLLLRELSVKSGTVVACGGGMPCYGDNIEIMRLTGVVVYLKMTPEAIADRLKKARNERPLLKNLSGEPLYDKIVSLLDERSKFFDQAHFYINGINVNLNGLKEQVVDYLSKQK